MNYIHDGIGYNFSLPALNAAFGLGQIENLGKILKKKRKINNYYKKSLKKMNKFTLYIPSNNYSKNNFWMNIISIKKPNILLKNKILKIFKKNKIQARSVRLPNHLQKPYVKCQKYRLSNCLSQFNSSMCLPSSYNLTKNQQDKVIKIIKKLDG